MKKYLSILFVLVGLLLVSSGADASSGSGACSWHNGVDCDAGADWDGSVICNDGWRDSSVKYSSLQECSVSANKSEALVVDSRDLYNALLKINDDAIATIEDKYIQKLNLETEFWTQNIKPQHQECLSLNPESYCDPYMVKNNWIGSSKHLQILAEFNNEVEPVVMRKAMLGYVGIENGQVVQAGPILDNPSFLKDFPVDNRVFKELSRLSVQYGDFLRQSIKNFDSANYRDLSQQLLNELANGEMYYYYFNDTGSYDRVLYFNGSPIVKLSCSAYGAGSYLDSDGMCRCSQGYTWNAAQTACVTTPVPSTLLSSYYNDNSGATKIVSTQLPTVGIYNPTKKDSALTRRLSGNILLQVESHGEAWYMNPADGLRYYMKDGFTAYDMMRSFGLGITDSDLEKIPSISTPQEMTSSGNACSSNATANRLKGKILLQVQQHGEAWYIDPRVCRRIYMKDGDVAYQIMRYLGLGIMNTDLEKLPSGNNQ